MPSHNVPVVVRKLARPISRTLLITLVLALLLTLDLFTPLAYAAGETVVNTTSLADDQNDGACSLREALQAAFLQQVNGTASETYHECKASAGPTTILFAGSAAGGVIKLTADQDPLPMINKEVIIVGPVVIQGGGIPAQNAIQRDTRLFQVSNSGTLTLVGLTLKDGYTTGYGAAIYGTYPDTTINLSGVALINNVAEGNGGAIYTTGKLMVLASSFSGNQALGVKPDAVTDEPTTGFGGAIQVSGSGGAGISLANFSGNIASKGGGAISSVGAGMIISDTVFNGNIANAIGDNQGGGAIMNHANGYFNIGRSFFNGNLSPKGDGGAIYNNLNATLSTIIDSAFSGNISGDLAQAGRGGAIYTEEDLNVNRVTFNANIATGNGLGGAILNNKAAVLQLTNATFFANVVPNGKGAALANIDTPFPVSSDSTAKLRNVTISNNTANSGGAIYNEEAVELWNTIVEEGTAGSGGTCGGSKPVTDNGHNLQDPGTACGAGIPTASADLDVPKPAGGPLVWLLMQAPKAGSPAIDAGDNAVCDAPPVNKKDAGDSSRPNDGDGDLQKECDIGAVEAGQALPGFGSDPAQPGPIDFGNVEVNTSNDAGFKVSETGLLPLVIASFSFVGNNAGDFQMLTPFPVAIPNNAPAVTLQLRCTPSAAGPRTATLSLFTDDPKNLKVDYNLTCYGTNVPRPGFSSLPLAPGPLDFGSVIESTPKNVALQVIENGNATLNVTLDSITGDHAGDFSIFTGLPAQVTDGGAPKNVSVRCTPSGLGIRTAQLNLTTDDPQQPSVTFNLVCNGAPAPVPFLAAPGTAIAGLNGAYGVAVSPDTRNVYVTSFYGGTLTRFDRDLATGLLTQIGSQSFGLAGARRVAVSPDGKQVYATASVSNTFTVYSRDTNTGQLNREQTLVDSGVVDGLNGAHGVTVSPDGRHIYVASLVDDALVTFSRDADGFISYDDAILSAADLDGARGVAVSPDGLNVYVAGYASATQGTLAVYARNPTDGLLTHLQTRRETDVIQLFPTTKFLEGLKGAFAVTVSNDGQYVYVAGIHSNSLVVFRRDTLTGILSYLQTYKDGVGGINGLAGATSVVLSPDNTHLYTSAWIDDAVAVFDRDPNTGLLTFVEAHLRDAGTGLPKLDAANETTVSPDGSTVYAVAGEDDSVVAFAVANPQATLDSLLPASVQEGAAGFTLVLKGKNFVGGSQVFWQGSVRPTTYFGTGELRAEISAGDVSAAGTAAVKVVSPAPGGGDSANELTFTITAQGQNPVPSIDYISPQSVEAVVQQFKLTVFGTNFVQGAKVRYNGIERPTTFVDSGTLEAQINAEDVAAALEAQSPDALTAAANQPAGITVQNPPPGGGISNAVIFTVLEAGQNPAPALTQLQPAAIIEQGATAAGLTVKLTGANFMESSQAYWNGAPRPTSFVNATTLQLTLLGGDVAFAGNGSVNVTNPAPGGGTSNALAFAVTATPPNPEPAITTLSPASTVQKVPGNPVVVTVNGSDFLPSAGVYLNGVYRQTTFVNSTRLRFTLTMTDVQVISTRDVEVINPPPGGGTSNKLSFKVLPPTQNPVPAIQEISPSFVAALGQDSVPVKITVTGANFVAASVVQWDGAPRPTTFVDDATLEVTLSADDVAENGVGALTVVNPSPGGGTSNAVEFYRFGNHLGVPALLR